MSLMKHLQLSLLGRASESLILLVLLFLLSSVMAMGVSINEGLQALDLEHVQVGLFFEDMGLMIFWGTVGTMVFTLSLLSLLFLKKRFYEIAVYSSLGRRRLYILLQVVLELQVIALIALIPAFLIGGWVASLFSYRLLDEAIIFLNFRTIVLFFSVTASCICLAMVLPCIYVLSIDPTKMLEKNG